MTLPVFVINPDSRPDRWAAMSAQLDRLGIAAERIPAVDARLLAAQEEWEQRTNGNAPEWHVDDLGAVACALSHCKAWGALLASRHPAALVLEDDAELASDLPALLESLDWWPAGVSLVRLETIGRRSGFSVPSAAGRLPEEAFGRWRTGTPAPAAI